MLRIKEDLIRVTNRKLYIEASFNTLPDINYELWLLRTYFPDCMSHYTFGMALIPKE